MEVENMHVQLSADAQSFNTAIGSAVNNLSRLAIEEKSLKAQEDVLNRSLASNAEKISSLGAKCEATAQKIAKKNERITDAIQKYGEESTQVAKLKEQLAKLELQYATQSEKLSKASEKADRLSSQLADVKAKEQNLAAQVKSTNDTLDKQQKEFAETAQSGMGMGNQLQSAFLMLKGLAVGYAGKTLFNALVGSNADYEQSMTSFEVLLQSAEKADKLMNDMTQFAADTPFEMEDLQKGAQTLLSFGTAETEVIKKMQQLGDLSQGMPDKFERITMAYGKMNAKGKVTLEELNMLTEAGVPILKQLAEQSGVTQEQLFKNISDGKLGIDDINKAIESMTSSGGQFFGMMEKQSATMEGMWSTLSDNVSIFTREMGEETFITLKNELSELLDTVNHMSASGELSEMAQEWGQNIAWFVTKIVEAIEILYDMRSVLIGAGAAWATWKTLNTVIPMINTTASAIKLLSTVIQLGATKQQLSNLIDGKTVLLKNSVTGAITIETAAKAKEAIATDSATYSQLKFNAALLANPYTWVAVGIGVLVSALMGYNQHMEQAQQQAEQARQEAVQLADEYKQESQSITELTKRYEELATSTKLDESAKQELKSLQEQLNSLFGTEAENLDLVNGKYEEQIEKIRTLIAEKARETATELYGKYYTAKTDISKTITSEKSMDGSQFDTKGTLSELASHYKWEIEHLKNIEKEHGNLTKTEQRRLKTASDLYVKYKKQLEENMVIVAQYHAAMVASGQMTEKQANAEKIAIAGSLEAWAELTSAKESDAEASDTAGDAGAESAEQQAEALKKIKSNLSAVQTALKELKDSKQINISTMETLIAAYPELINCLDDESKLQEELIKKETEEKNNYLTALKEKYADTVLFGDNVSDEHKTLIDNLAKAYDVDIKNFQSVAEIKKNIDTLLMQTLGENWSKYYSSQADALRAFIGINDNFTGPLPAGASYSQYTDPQLQKQVEQAKASLAALEAIAKVTGSYSPNTVNLNSSSGNGGKKDDAAKKEAERIKALFEEQDRYRQMNWISEAEYWDRIIALRDTYYAKGSDDWWSWTLKIQKQNETNHKNYVDTLENEFDDYLSVSSDYIKKCEENGWGTDSEIEAYRRRGEEIKKFQNEFLSNEQLTADERNELWTKADAELYSNMQLLKQALNSDLTAKNQQSSEYISDRTYFNDWSGIGDSPEDAYNRVKERNRQAVNDGYMTEAEYAEFMKSFGEELYSGRLENSYNWLEHERNYNNMSVEDYIAGLERMRAYTQEYYELGIIDYRKYSEEMQSINEDIFDENASLVDDIIKSGNEAYEKAKSEFEEMTRQLQDTWNHDDRLKSISEISEELSEFEGAVTDAGKDKYKQLQEEMLRLQREEELYYLEQENNAILEDMNDALEYLESLQVDKLDELITSMDNVQSSINAIVAAAEQLVMQQNEKAQSIASTYTTNNSIIQNNTITDTVAANALMGSVIGILK